MRPQHRNQANGVDRQTQAQATATENAARQVDRKPGVLVVDGDNLVRIMLQLGLARHGFRVWLAQNGQEAINLYRAHQGEIAVVVLDVRIPSLEGAQTLDTLRVLNPDITACFMCENARDDERVELSRRRGTRIIDKPFLLDELAAILRLLTHGPSASLSTPVASAQA